MPARMDCVRQWIAASAAACVLVLSACASTVAGTPVRASSPFHESDDLTAMLLSIEDIRRIVGAEDLEIDETYDRFLDYADFSPEACVGVPFNTIERAYRNSGYEAVRGIVMQTAGEIAARWVDEGVVRFDTAEEAHRFVTDSSSIWRDCAGTEVRAVPDEETGLQIWAIGDTINIPDVPESRAFMVTSVRLDVADHTCAHVMTDRADLVIDVVVCGPQATEHAVTIMDRIANRPPI
jgi:serine/threonine kinase PknH